MRDQCLEAKRYFLSKDIDHNILEKALAYCLENDTPSFSNLHDIYVYFMRESEGGNDILQEIQTLECTYQGIHEPLDVNERSLSVYEELVRKTKEALT